MEDGKFMANISQITRTSWNSRMFSTNKFNKRNLDEYETMTYLAFAIKIVDENRALSAFLQKKKKLFPLLQHRKPNSKKACVKLSLHKITY